MGTYSWSVFSLSPAITVYSLLSTYTWCCCSNYSSSSPSPSSERPIDSVLPLSSSTLGSSDSFTGYCDDGCCSSSLESWFGFATEVGSVILLKMDFILFCCSDRLISIFLCGTAFNHPIHTSAPMSPYSYEPHSSFGSSITCLTVSSFKLYTMSSIYWALLTCKYFANVPISLNISSGVPNMKSLWGWSPEWCAGPPRYTSLIANRYVWASVYSSKRNLTESIYSVEVPG